MNKLILVGLFTCAVALWWRQTQLQKQIKDARKNAKAQAARKPAQVAAPAAMLTCSVCGAHMDARLAHHGKSGPLCEEHKAHS